MTLNPMTTGPAYQGWAVDFLNPRIEPHFRAFEWGSGWSTIWLGVRCANVVSVEHDAEWHATAAQRLQEYGLGNVKLFHIPKEQGASEYADYADAILAYPDEHFHLICVDGRNRAGCIRNAMVKLARPGGMMVVDDYPRAQYQPALRLLDGWSRALFNRASEIMATGVWFRPTEG